MKKEIVERLQHYQIQLMAALDANEYIDALKIRAVQRELEELIPLAEEEDNWAKTFFNSHFTSQEAGNILDLDSSNMTRYHEEYKGKNISGKWYFPKEEIQLVKENRKNKKKTGPKRKKINISQ